MSTEQRCGRPSRSRRACGRATRPAAALVLGMCAALLGPGVRAAQRGLEAEAEGFRRNLLAALERSDRAAVARMVRYRLIVDAGLAIPIVDTASLFRHWDLAFSAETRCLIEGSRLPVPGAPPPRYATRVEDGAVTFGNGRIRAERGADGLKITRIAMPPGSTGGPRKPREVIFTWGKGRVTYSGRLTADYTDVYLIRPNTGDLLNVQLERVPAGKAALRVIHDAGGRVLPASGPRGADTGRVWAGPIPERGLYRIEVARRTAYCDPAVAYRLTIRLD